MTDRARVAELLEIEQLCDQFESQLMQGRRPDLGDFLLTVPGEIRDRVRENLRALIEPVGADAVITAVDDLSSRVTETMSELEERFSLISCVGRGGTAEVWKAAERSTGRVVAVKVANSATPSMVERFRREADTAGQLCHPRIPRVFEFGVSAGRAFVVTQFIDGQSLESYLKSHVIDCRRAAEIAFEIAAVIAYAHACGVVHRDLKPQNILIDDSGVLFLTDFGHAKDLAPSQWDSLTRTGEILGTPAYMAPEQARGEGKRASEATDVYAIGAILYRILMDEVPFRGNVQSVIYQILNTEIVSLRRTRPHIPIALDLIVGKCLQKSTGDRFTSAQDLADELQRFLGGQSIHTKPISRIRKAAMWTRRHPRTAALLALTTCLLVALSIGSTVVAISLQAALMREQKLHNLAQQLHSKSLAARRDAEAAQAQAESNAMRAQQESQKAWQIESFLSQLFESPDRAGLLLNHGILDDSAGTSPTLGQIIQRGVERVHTDLSDQPAVQAHLLEILANASRVSLDFEAAQSLFDEAAAIRSSPGYAGGASESLFRMRGQFYLARLYQDQGRLPTATEIYQAIVAAAPENRIQRLLQADAYFQLATIHSLQFESEAAKQFFIQSLQIRSQELPANSRPIVWAQMALRLNSSSGDFSSLVSELSGIEGLPEQFMNLGMNYLGMKSDWSRGRYQPAIARYQQIIEELVRELGPSSHIIFLARGEFAGLLYDAGDYRRAYPLITQLLSAIDGVAPNNIHVLNAKLKIAEELMRGERLTEASFLLEDLAKSYHCIAEYPSELQLNLIWSRLFHGDIEGAREISSFLVTRESAAQSIEFAWFCYSHARVLQALGQVREAETFDARALELARQQTLENGAAWLERLSVIHSHNHELEIASQLLTAAIARETERRGGLLKHPRVARYQCALASVYQQLGQLEACIECLEQAYSTWEATLPTDDPRIASTAAKIAALKSKQAP